MTLGGGACLFRCGKEEIAGFELADEEEEEAEAEGAEARLEEERSCSCSRLARSMAASCSSRIFLRIASMVTKKEAIDVVVRLWLGSQVV